MNIDGAFPGKFLAVADLDDQDLSLTIKSVEMGELGQGDQKQIKPIIYFKEEEKGLALNKTNANVIKKLFGAETEDWIGKKITLWPNHDVEFKGEVVSAIRVRSRAPKASPNGKTQQPGGKFTQMQSIVMDKLMVHLDGDMQMVGLWLDKHVGVTDITDLDDKKALMCIEQLAAGTPA